jgi:hypothetical protein
MSLNFADFAPRVLPCEVKGDEGILVFFVREVGGEEMFEKAKLEKAKAKKKKDSGAAEDDDAFKENARQLFKDYVVHEDGTPISDAEIASAMKMRFRMLMDATTEINRRLGVVPDPEKKV